jgi:hypothetical protein
MAEITYKVHRVMEGPFLCPEDDWWLTCLVEDVDAGDLFHDDIPFVSFDAAYKFQSHFLKAIDPIVITIPYEDNYDA